MTSRADVRDEAIAFPDHVETYDDIVNVLPQIPLIEQCPHRASNFDLTPSIDVTARSLMFSYFLGVMAGDMSKHGNYSRTPPTMTALLQLSKRHESNLRFGNFVTFCAGMLGIHMRRIKDYARPADVPFDAYRWTSKQSRTLMWMFEQCLGLREGETTTDCPIRADWLAEAPAGFQRCFVQGVADSDGYVDVNKHEIGIVVDPNEMLIGKLLSNLQVEFRPAVKRNQATVIMSIWQGFRVPIFSPHAKTHKFELAKKLVEAKRFHGAWPSWLRQKVNLLIDQHEPSGQIVRTILEEHNIAIRSQHVRKLSKKRLKKVNLMPGTGIS